MAVLVQGWGWAGSWCRVARIMWGDQRQCQGLAEGWTKKHGEGRGRGRGHSVKLRRAEEGHVSSAWEREGEMQVPSHV